MVSDCINILTSTGKILGISQKIANRIPRIRELLFTVSGRRLDPVPLREIHPSIFTLIVKWAQHHEYDPVSVDDFDEWDVSFFDKNRETILKIVIATSLMEFEMLFQISRLVLEQFDSEDEDVEYELQDQSS
ncbi:E3 ubiquitin ligase complex SCF subunit sconC-like [Teleopsis dalmanni]|uniref:E3 ubiquitin ligase complex SCF subunit sconC-like n=1 Tax=Teleopsis dalmanni TaxID=139649 RepID=UPI0018CD2E19|nr:E3 ubiquitin ligase complex SCF subunit sconC-like [Teleopsis dalmanni]